MTKPSTFHAAMFGALVAMLSACAAAPVSKEHESVMSSAKDRSTTAHGTYVIAHRGASGLLPEHTLPAYKLAIEQGADFIEPDLNMTRDGVLVARHDPWLSDSTNVADLPQFANRKRVIASPTGQPIEDWWTFDFTLAELKTLKARQTRPGRSKADDDKFDIPTFDEIIALARSEGNKRGRTVGLYPEAKWPVEHTQAGLNMQKAFVTALTHAGMTGADAPVYVQCFDADFLIALNDKIDTPLIQLEYADARRHGAPTMPLEQIARYADGVGPYKYLMITPDTGAPTGYGEQARNLGLEVHPWTFRDDDPPDWGDAKSELQAAIDAGATGVFTDFPATAVSLLNKD